MNTISFRVKEEEYDLIQNYVAANKISLSAFIREAALDKIEEDFALDEKRILDAKERAKSEKTYSHEEVWKELGI